MLKLAVLIALFAIVAAPAMAEQIRETLISANKNINLEQWSATSEQLTPKSLPWSIRKFALHGGKQEGVDVIVLNNGKLKMTICPTRGMGIISVNMDDLRLGWDSPVKEVVNPRHVNLQSRGGLGWLEGFNEWLVRCGLESTGHPGTDKFINNVGDEATMELTLHGKIANIPASEVEVVVDKEAPYRIRIRGRVDERMFYGPKLELWTEVSTEPGSNQFRISDQITSRGADQQEFQVLYHCNYGPPLLEEGATFSAAMQRVVPFNANAAKGINSFKDYAGPKLGFIEQVYCVYPLAGADGRTMAMIANKAKNRAVSVMFSPKELPYLTLWKNTNALEEGYVTGIEPGTSFPYNRRIERKFGRVPKLPAGATRTFTLDYAIHIGESEVKAAGDRVQQIQSGHEVTIDQQPAPTE